MKPSTPPSGQPDQRDPAAPSAGPDGDVAAAVERALATHLSRVEELLAHHPRAAPQPAPHLPAWRRRTRGETRWPVAVAIVLGGVLQLTLPTRLSFQPGWVLTALAAVMLVALLVVNPFRVDRESTVLRLLSLGVASLVSLANAWSAGRLVVGLIGGTSGTSSPRELLTSAGAIWLTNVIVFALWYWEFDRGGPAARAAGRDPLPDFLFPQMQAANLAPADWEPTFLDYFYVSFTNATAFSPTDTMPLSRWAKMTMMLQSAVSLVTVALVVARAVNILH
jgi:uncharacterized membrane protein